MWIILSSDGAVSYDMPQGERRGLEVDLYDFTYDGTINDNSLSGGLGQLMDGVEGQSNFRVDPSSIGIKGYEWVGWKNESFTRNPLEIIFKFDAVRNFSALRLHVNNMYSKEVRVFSGARVYFSLNGRTYKQPPVDYQYMRDTLIEYARTVNVPLGPNNIGRYVRVQFYFDSKWLLVSEVQFESSKFMTCWLWKIIHRKPKQ